MQTRHFLLFSLLLVGPVFAGSLESYRAEWATLRPKLDADIERYRKGDAAIELVDAAGKPVTNATLTIRQKTHAFLFGCNILPLGQLGDLNTAYEEEFVKLFNLATTTFCWGAVESKQGQLRFAEGSEEIWRRPPPDRVLAFCKKYGIKMKGQPLMAGSWHPAWAPKEPEQAKKPEPIPTPVPPEAKPAPLLAAKNETPPVEKEPPLPVEEPFPPVRGAEAEGAIEPPREIQAKETIAAPREKRAPSPAKPPPGTGLKRLSPEDGIFVKAKRAWAAGRMAEAEASLREILETNPGHLQSRLMLATLLLNENRLAEAVRVTDAVPAGQGGIGLIVIRARALDGLGQTEAALDYLQRTAPKGKEPPQAVEQLRGAMLQKLGRFSESADVYRRLVSRGPMDAQSWAGFGIALEGAGDRGEALSAYRKALAINNLPPSLNDYLRRRVNLLSNGAPL
ncbi:MAG: hypothetical protein A2286_13370 [Gammaproteobacteria bacterium RIFOXYA12_FULL_61_12]|nr:MAG: hypothetical protein A2286_13370 [Gammaproteobacteria bacterium RIFOXYA12_FULL_61_12]